MFEGYGQKYITQQKIPKLPNIFWSENPVLGKTAESLESLCILSN